MLIIISKKIVIPKYGINIQRIITENDVMNLLIEQAVHRGFTRISFDPDETSG